MAGLSHAPFGVPCVRNNQGLELSRQKDVSDRYGETLIALLDRESVSLYEGTSFTGEESLIPRERALRLADQPSIWEPAGPAERHIRAAATGSGDQEYKRSKAP